MCSNGHHMVDRSSARSALPEGGPSCQLAAVASYGFETVGYDTANCGRPDEYSAVEKGDDGAERPTRR